MRILISFASPEYQKAQCNLNETAAPYFDAIRPYHPDTLDADFLAKHSALMHYRRGFGFWCWKSYLIARELHGMADDDVLMYCDSQKAFIADPAPLFDLCRRQGRGVLLFHQLRDKRFNREWTKRDMFILMGCDEPRYWDGPQVNSAMMVWTRQALALAEEAYEWNSNFHLISDEASTLGPDFPEFRDYRHDQSIISLLAIREGLETMPDPSQFGVGYEQPGRNYGQVVEFRRTTRPPYPIPDRQPLAQPLVSL